MAGIIDADGYLGIQKTHRETFLNGIKYEICIKIGMNDEDFIKWLKASFGGNIHKRTFPDNRKDFYSWTIRGCKSVSPILDKVYPYLKVKKGQGELLKKFVKTFYRDNYEIVKNGEHKRGVHKQIKKEIRTKRERLYWNLRKLNQIGKLAA